MEEKKRQDREKVFLPERSNLTNKSDHRRAAGKRFDLTNGSPLREYNRYTDYPSVIPGPFRGSGIEAVCPLFDRVYAIIFRVIRTAATAGLNPPLTVAAKRILTKFHSESDAVRKKRSNARARRGKKKQQTGKKGRRAERCVCRENVGEITRRSRESVSIRGTISKQFSGFEGRGG